MDERTMEDNKEVLENKEVVNETPEVEEPKRLAKPTGYYLAEVPTGLANVIAFEGKQVSAEELLITLANAMKDAGLLK